MSNSTRSPQEIRAALKLIEQLYHDGEIPKHVWKNIEGEYYAETIDKTENPYIFKEAS